MRPIATLFCCLLPLFAQAAHQHVHGQARLDVAVERGRIDLRLESPLDNLLGFEHAPANLAELDATKAMVSKLRSAQNLFVTSPAAGCKLIAVKLESSAIPAAILQGGSGPAAKPGKQDHGDLDAEFSLLCARPDALHQIDVRLFETFPHLRSVDVQLLSPRGQTGQRLTPSQRVLAW